MGKVNAWTVGLICSFAAVAGSAIAQEGDDAPSCWWEYASCARQSQGEAQWRSICYADFSSCIGTMKLPVCPATPTVADCLSYKAECDALAAGDVQVMADCTDDADACALAHGC